MRKGADPSSPFAVCAGVLAVFLAACAPRASLRTPHGEPPTAQRAPERVEIPDVPFYSNTTDQCGPTALASVLSYWGKLVTPEQLKSEVYLPKQRGTLPMDMKPAVETKGLSAHVISGTFDDIRVELRESRPVIAYLDFGTRKHPIGHFLVIIGFDEARHGLYVHSGPAKNKFVTYRRFNRGWKDADHWMMVVGPKQMGPNELITKDRRAPDIAARMSADDYFQLGNAYEQQASTAEARAQYQLALGQNKNFEPALMGLGNLAFQDNDYKTAEKYYRRVLRKDPAHGGANNNLAMVYLSSGKDLDAAKKLAEKAALTEYKPFAEDTLRQIEARAVTSSAKPTPIP